MAATGQDNGVRDHLTSAQRRLSSLRDQRAEARRERDGAKRALEAANRPGKITDWPEFRDAERAAAR